MHVQLWRWFCVDSRTDSWFESVCTNCVAYCVLGFRVCLHAGVGCCLRGRRPQLCADIYQRAWIDPADCWLGTRAQGFHRYPSLGDDGRFATLRQDGAAGHFAAILCRISVHSSQTWRSICEWIHFSVCRLLCQVWILVMCGLKWVEFLQLWIIATMKWCFCLFC